MGTRALHGSNSRYQMGCRCLLCADARATYMRTYRARRKVEAIEVDGVYVGHKVTVGAEVEGLDGFRRASEPSTSVPTEFRSDL